MKKCDIMRYNVFICILHFSFALGGLNRSMDDHSYIRRRRHNKERGCILPPHPEHGQWNLLNGDLESGTTVPKNSVIRFECNLGYKTPEIQYFVCNKSWEPNKFPECEALCPPLYSSSTVKVKCKNKNGKDVKCNEATEGTYLKYKCAPFYETPFGYRRTLLCSEGSWNYPKPVCQPECGKTIPDDAKLLIYGSEPNTRLKYPWVTAVYKKMNDTYENICGGSIISLNIVLTAAHCVTNDYGDVFPKEDFRVGAGKIYRKYEATEDSYAQYLEIYKIIVHEDYKGDRRRFLGDIAVLVTKTTFVLNEVVQPICITDVNHIALHAGSVGEVSGWGTIENGNTSEVLRTLRIPYKYELTCAQELPSDWADKYNIIDKICAGLLNQNKSVCTGDSGSGLAFKNPDNSRYYIHGLVSLGPTTNQRQCDIQQNSLYTSTSFYYEFIDRLLTKYAVEIEDCVLPSHPHNGKWSIDQQERKPGDIVQSNTILKITCNLGFKLSSTATHIECGSIQNMPKCQLLCPPVTLPGGADYRCTNKDGKIVNCLDAVDGTILYFACPGDHEYPKGTSGIRSCTMGSWGFPEPECLKKNYTTPLPVTKSLESPTSTQSNKFAFLTPSLTADDEPALKVVCVYAGHRYYDTNVDPDDLDSSLCTHILYSYVRLTTEGSLQLLGTPVAIGATSKSLFQKVSDMKLKNPKLKVLLTVRESDEEGEYSTIAADPGKRDTLIRSIVSFMEIYKYDGVDISWVPQRKDKDNYINFLKEIKKEFKPRNLLLTASVYVTTYYLGYSGNQMSKLLDWIHVENYNNYGVESIYTGQYSAFEEASKEDELSRALLNMVNSGHDWINEGMKKEQIFLSIAFYGRYFTLQDPKKHRVHSPTVPGNSGILTYSEICQNYGNWKRVWDKQQKNPYKYSGNKWFGYDDPESVKIKAQHIVNEEFGGVTIYSIDADDIEGKCGPKQGLLKEVHLALDNPLNLNIARNVSKCKCVCE